jgi:hypothetical protein
MLTRLRPLLTMATCALAMPALAQAPPTTTAFDGTYVGVSRTFEEDSTPFGAGSTWTHYCPQPGGPPAPLTIVNGTAKAGKLEGSVSQQGVLVMRDFWSRFDGQIDSQGTVRGRTTSGCSYLLMWQKVPPPTMPFDGDYVGVSRESTGGSPQCPSNGVPSTLIIRNSAVLGDFWQGSVSQQGNLVIQTPRGMQVRGQIDNQGVIRVQGGNSACTVILVWRKQSG